MADVLASPAAAQFIARAREMQAELIRETIAIAEIPAPTFAESDRARYVAERIQALGVPEVEVDPAGNVVGRIPGAAPIRRPALVLAAHLDTVFPLGTDVTVRGEGDVLRGPGVGDNSASVATMLWAAHLLVQSGLQLSGDVVVAATVGEEGLGDLRGMRGLLDHSAVAPDFVICLDGTLGGLVRQAVGSRRFRLVVEAEGGHSWGAFGMPSAIHSLARMVSRISDLSVPPHPKTTYNVGLVEGGTAVNAIAAHAEAVVDLRSVDGNELARLEHRVRDIVVQVANHTGVRARMELVGDRPLGSIPDDHPLCLAVRSVHDRLGIVTRVYPSSTDGNIPLSRGIPAVTVGVTLGGNGHRSDEFIQVGPLTTGLAQVLLLILAAQNIPIRTP